jgi:hypothetical protein
MFAEIAQTSTWLIAALAFLLGCLLVGLLKGRGSPDDEEMGNYHKMEIPKVWPFDLRRVAGTEERKIWDWLRETFPDHQVLIKLPVTRFVIPQRPGSGREWFRMLSTVYCTFTVCTNDGRVVGCLDVMANPNSLSPINRQVKETLFDQCGISYWAVLRDRLPNGETLRAEFLAENSPRDVDMEPPASVYLDPPASMFGPAEDVRQRLHQTLNRNRRELRFQTSIHPELDSRPVSLDTNGPFSATLPPELDAPTRPGGSLTEQQSRRAGLDVI